MAILPLGRIELGILHDILGIDSALVSMIHLQADLAQHAIVEARQQLDGRMLNQRIHFGRVSLPFHSL
jgi:hypothetical protein